MAVGGKAAERDRQVHERLRSWPDPLPQPEDAGFAEVFHTFADARVVLLGEASHG